MGIQLIIAIWVFFKSFGTHWSLYEYVSFNIEACFYVHDRLIIERAEFIFADPQPIC
jgi:hypothetical protein